MQLADMTVIETTYEMVRGEFVYQVSVSPKHTIIKRTKAEERPLWHHGVLTQCYDRAVGAFVPMIKTKEVFLPTAEAEAVMALL